MDFNEVWCTGTCAEAFITLYEECNSLGDEQAYRAGCGRGPGGKLCTNIDTDGTVVTVNMSLALPTFH